MLTWEPPNLSNMTTLVLDGDYSNLPHFGLIIEIPPGQHTVIQQITRIDGPVSIRKTDPADTTPTNVAWIGQHIPYQRIGKINHETHGFP